MGNKRKTRKEKVIADLRRQLYSLGNQNIASSQTNKPKELNNKLASPILVNTYLINAYPYLLHDILKTGILTMSIIAIQIILFLILKNHIIKLPGISY